MLTRKQIEQIVKYLARPRPGASISSSTFKIGWPRAKARPMNGGRRSTTSNRWPPRSCISGSMG